MPNSYTKQRIAFFLFCFLLGSLAFSQTSSLSLSSGSAVEGGSVSLNLSLSASGGAPAGLQWTLSFVPTDATSVVVAAGAALSGATNSWGHGPPYSRTTFGIDVRPEKRRSRLTT